MANQHFMNSTQSLVPDALEGLLAANPNFVRLDGFPHVRHGGGAASGARLPAPPGRVIGGFASVAMPAFAGRSGGA